MRKLLTYLPSLFTIIVIITLDEGWAKWLLLAVLVLSVILAKFKRNKFETDEVEYDERVNINIRYWSFGFLVVTNAILIMYFMLVSQSMINEWMTADYVMIYLSATMLIALYVIPSIARKF
ncbi:hypothetical protein [Paenibacillus mendelii]|uniref:Group-specific protein n=1 Tax=Paenibacillus mendelii TaxID=206163 RepID=A0ABV6J4N7_9BACL|nr:hypothetical protein [Paenibacillus mendelii]MCQ6562812.1 hypothetical protein [Paenibacillus mendelii]